MNERRGSGRKRWKSALVTTPEPLSLSNNERQIMSLIRKHKTISRAELAGQPSLPLSLSNNAVLSGTT